MEQDDTIMTFETIYTTNAIQILKLAHPLLPPQIQPLLAVLVKIRELQYCLSLLPGEKIKSTAIELDALDRFFDSALPYCDEKQRTVFLQLKKIRKTLSMFEKMEEITTLFGGDLTDLFESDTANLFSFFSNMENAAPESDKQPSDHTYTQSEGTSQAQDEAAPQSESALTALLKNALSEEQIAMYEKFKKTMNHSTL